MVCSFLSNDNIYEYISNMGSNLTPYTLALGEETIYFLTPLFKFIGTHKIEFDDLLSRNENLLIRLIIMFQILEKILLRSCDYINSFKL